MVKTYEVRVIDLKAAKLVKKIIDSEDGYINLTQIAYAIGKSMQQERKSAKTILSLFRECTSKKQAIRRTAIKEMEKTLK